MNDYKANEQVKRVESTLIPILGHNYHKGKIFFQEYIFFFVTEEIQYHGGLRLRELGQAPYATSTSVPTS